MDTHPNFAWRVSVVRIGVGIRICDNFGVAVGRIRIRVRIGIRGNGNSVLGNVIRRRILLTSSSCFSNTSSRRCARVDSPGRLRKSSCGLGSGGWHLKWFVTCVMNAKQKMMVELEHSVIPIVVIVFINTLQFYPRTDVHLQSLRRNVVNASEG